MITPYFYIIQHIPSKKYYAGCKINSSADPSNLMTNKGYKTTSKVVKKLIEEDGLDSFVVLKLKTFQNAQEALDYECKFLKRVNAAENTRFINLHNGGKNFVNKGGYKLSESTKNKMRKPKSDETVRKQTQALKNRSRESYEKMVTTRKNNGMPWISEEQRIKIANFNSTYWSEEQKEKHRQTMIDFYKKNPISEDTKIKLKALNSGKSNNMYGKKHSDHTKEKMRAAWQKRKNLNK
jgi:hypothetical protein